MLFVIKRYLIGFLFILLSNLWAAVVFAFPFMVTEGYTSCTSCHVSASGGGILTNYGRAQSKEILSTWGSDKEIFEYPEALAVQADIRHLTFRTKKIKEQFLMQKELQLAVKPLADVTLVGSYGEYGLLNTHEFRTNYILIDFNEFVHVRAGHYVYYPGLNLPDHTTAISPGEGTESYNADLRLSSSVGELTASAIFGDQRSITGTPKNGYQLDKEKTGYGFKMVTYPMRNSIIGYNFSSYLDVQQGPFGIIGSDDLSLLFQYNFAVVESFYTELGYIPFKGIRFSTGAEGKRQAGIWSTGYFLQANWFPRPHWEILTKFDRSYYNLEPTDRLLTMLHFYL